MNSHLLFQQVPEQSVLLDTTPATPQSNNEYLKYKFHFKFKYHVYQMFLLHYSYAGMSSENAVISYRQLYSMNSADPTNSKKRIRRTYSR